VVFAAHRSPRTASAKPSSSLGALRPTLTVILIYCQNYVAWLSSLHYQVPLLTLSETARRKILTKTHKLRRGLAHQLDHARAP
jgi:hypothetical protein